jgi:hypothetical protein
VLEGNPAVGAGWATAPIHGAHLLGGVSCPVGSRCVLVDSDGDEFGGPVSVATGSRAALTGIATGRQSLAFAFKEPAGDTPIDQLTITMPNGIKLSRSKASPAASVHVSIAGAQPSETVTARGRQLVISLGTATQAAHFVIDSPLIAADAALKGLAKRRKLESLEISIATFAADATPSTRFISMRRRGEPLVQRPRASLS